MRGDEITQEQLDQVHTLLNNKDSVGALNYVKELKEKL